MTQTYSIKFKYANWAHLFQYYFYDELLHLTKDKIKDFSYSYQIKCDGNLVFIEITDDLDKLIWWPEFYVAAEAVPTEAKKLALAMNAEIAELDAKKLAYEILNVDRSLTPTKIGNEILYAESDTLEAPYLKLKLRDTKPHDRLIYANIISSSTESAVMAAVLLDPYLAAIERAIQINHDNILVSKSNDILNVRSEQALDLGKIIDKAIKYLHKEAFDKTCDKNRDYLIKNLDTAQIFEYSGCAVSRAKAAEIIKSTDITKALRSIEFDFDD
jgi:hypothetical protein